MSAVQDESTMTEVYYIVKDPKHETEKPYSLYYEPDDGIPRTNVSNEARIIKVVNARNMGRNITFEEFGFAALSLKSVLSPDDFYQQDRVINVYYDECRDLLRSLFSDAAKIEILEHVVCRSTSF